MLHSFGVAVANYINIKKWVGARFEPRSLVQKVNYLYNHCVVEAS